jgi:uncharacterized C2H2 Zn-finger protein
MTGLHEELRCPRCSFTTDRASSFRRHLNRKNECKPSLADVPVEELKQHANSSSSNAWKCENCGGAFKSAQSLSNHRRRCDRVDHVAILCARVAALEARLAELERNNGPAVPSASSSAAAPRPGLLPFGQERIDHIASDVHLLDECVRRPWSAMPKLLKELHWHASVPCNHNIRATNVRLPYLLVFDGTQWRYTSTDKVVYQLIARCMDIMDSHMEDHHTVDRLGPRNVQGYLEFCDRYDSNDKVLIGSLKRSVRSLLMESIRK